MRRVRLKTTCCSRLRQKLRTEVCDEFGRCGRMVELICVLVGGIYSVIKSKAPVTTAEYGDRYTLIGPLNHQSVRNCSDPIELIFLPQR